METRTAGGWQDQPAHGHKGVKIRLKFKMSELTSVAEASVGIHVPFHHKFSGLNKLERQQTGLLKRVKSKNVLTNPPRIFKMAASVGASAHGRFM